MESIETGKSRLCSRVSGKIVDKVIDYYRDCFSTPSGKRVLAHLLADMGYFDNNLKSPEEVAVANYAKTLLVRLGIIGTQNLDYFANMFINAPVIVERETDGE
jgi:hypothetical protein